MTRGRDATSCSTEPPLSKVRTFLLWALAVVWFSEMTLWAARPLAEMWTVFWQQLPQDDPQLTAALYMTHALEASAKGALGVLAVVALRSRSPSVRSALFVPMALVPPLNLAFQFRAQGFPLGPTTVGTVLSTILWGSFFLFRDPTDQATGATNHSAHSAPSRWAAFQRMWFGANGVILSLAASLFLLAPNTGLRSIFPCLSGPLAESGEATAGLTHSLMAVGTHVLAVAIATWIATAQAPSDPTVRRAVTGASMLQAGLICLLPLREIALDLGRACAASSVLALAVPLFGAWVLYAALSYRTRATQWLHRAQPVAQ